MPLSWPQGCRRPANRMLRSFLRCTSTNTWLRRPNNSKSMGFRCLHSNVRVAYIVRSTPCLSAPRWRDSSRTSFTRPIFATRGVAPRNARVVLTVYDMIHERFPEYFSIASPTRREKALAVTRADHVICISEQTRRDLIEFLGVSPAKTSVVYLGFSLTAAPQATIENGALSRPFVLYVGSRNGHKNFAGLLHAYAASQFLMDEFDLVCFGGGELAAKENELISELGIAAGKIRQVSGNDGLLGFYYQAARAFVCPSLYEGFGIPPLEAMSFGCPVVCSNTSSIPEVVGDAAEQFDPADHESMRKAIESVVGTDELRKNLIERGSERVGCFSWERCARETLDVYRRVCS